jgi:hypothetical protein
MVIFGLTMLPNITSSTKVFVIKSEHTPCMLTSFQILSRASELELFLI